MKKNLLIIFSVLIIIVGIVLFVLLGNKSVDDGEDKTEIAEKVFEDFSNGLKELNIEYTEASIDVSDYDALVARMYISGESRVAIYYLDVDNKQYEKIKSDGYITNNSNNDLIVSGIVENGYLFYLEQDFPKSTEVYELFSNIVNNK